MARRNLGRELWDRMCEFVESPDELHEYECGAWTIEKLYFLCNYLAQTTHAMVGNPKFSSVNYVDLFASSGVCVIDQSGRRKRYPGSALLAAGCQKAFDNLFLVDCDSERLDALVIRLKKLATGSAVRTWQGDANGLVNDIITAIPRRSLTVAFIDPFSLDIRFDTVRSLAERRPLDLIILLADSMDIVRNVDEYYYPRRSDKLDLFLGQDSGWRERYNRLQNREAGNIRRLFAEVYVDQLARLGYGHSRLRAIPTEGRPLYSIVYASKDSLGLKFWDIAESEDLSGNRSLWGI